MPWTEPLADSDELQRCIPDLVALSTLSAAWRNYDMRQIGDSIVAALITMLAAGFVFMALPGPDQVIELARSDPKLNPADLGNVRAILQREKGTLSSEQEFVVANVSGGRNLHVAAAPIGLDGDAVLAVGSSRGSFPTIDRFRGHRLARRLYSICSPGRFPIAGTCHLRRCDFICLISFRGEISRLCGTRFGLWCRVPADGRESLVSCISDPRRQYPS
jgi:hypothetical protein